MNSDDDLLFPDDNKGQEESPKRYDQSWKILIVDDEPSVHDVTVLALDDFDFEGRNLTFLHAYTAIEAIEILKQESDIALALIDVVMESEHAGLDLVDYIRKDLGNSIIRLVLRTGQPGQAPERSVISKYDINDYKDKTELTSQKLYSVVCTSIRSYRDMTALAANKKGLEMVIAASTEVYKVQQLSALIHGILEQLVALLYLDKDTVYVNFDSVAIEGVGGEAKILAGTGQYADLTGQNPFKNLDKDVLALLEQSFEKKNIVSNGNLHAIYFSPDNLLDDVLIFSSQLELSADSIHLLELFCNNLGVAYNNLLLHKEVEDTQMDILYMLGEAVERRPKEAGKHVRRVAEYSRLFARYIGLSQREVDLILLASPLHDFGKISIPESILHKPGKLDDDEWVIMQTHAEMGESMLNGSDREIMQMAAIISGQHHEKWDGSGYPKGLKGDEIHIYARITALADVFDTLGNNRVYKEPWPMHEVISYINNESGAHFDPQLVSLLSENVDAFEEISELYPD